MSKIYHDPDINHRPAPPTESGSNRNQRKTNRVMLGMTTGLALVAIFGFLVWSMGDNRTSVATNQPAIERSTTGSGATTPPATTSQPTATPSGDSASTPLNSPRNPTTPNN